MKKLFASMMILVFTMGIFSQTFAIDEESQEIINYGKDATKYQNELNKTISGKKYAKLADSVIEKYKNDDAFLQKLNAKLSKVDTSTLKNKDISNMLNYLEAKLNINLIASYKLNLQDLINPKISEADKKLIDENVVKTQQKVLENLNNSFSSAYADFKKMYNRKESGNMKINLLVDENNLGYLNTNIELNNYEAISNGFDSQTIGNLKVLLKSSKDNKNIDVELNSLVDIISKEGTLFMQFKDANLKENTEKYKNQEIDSIKNFVTKLQYYGIQNQYIKYEDVQTQNIFNMLKAIDYSRISSDLKTTLNQPLLEGYKKVGNKYYLRPTKYSCDSFKKLLNKFDPLYGESCSDKQYKSLLEDYNKMGKLYMIVSEKETTIGFEGNTNEQIDENNALLTFNDSSVTRLYYSIKPNQETNPGEHFYLELKDGKINSSLVLSGTQYDMTKKDFVTTNFKFETNGEVNKENKIVNLSSTYKGTYENGTEYVSGNFNIKDGKTFNFDHKTNTNTSIANISMNGMLDDANMLDDLSLNVDVKNKGINIDSEGNIKFDSDYSKTLEGKFDIIDKKLSGNFDFFSKGESAANLSLSGNYTKEIFNLNSRLKFSDDLSKKLFNYNSLVGNFELKIDTSNMKDNIYILFGLIADGKVILNYEIDNASNIKEGDNSEIKTPNNTIDIKEAFKEELEKLNPSYSGSLEVQTTEPVVNSGSTEKSK